MEKAYSGKETTTDWQKQIGNNARIEIGLEPLNDDEFIDCGKEELDMPKERY